MEIAGATHPVTPSYLISEHISELLKLGYPPITVLALARINYYQALKKERATI